MALNPLLPQGNDLGSLGTKFVVSSSVPDNTAYMINDKTMLLSNDVFFKLRDSFKIENIGDKPQENKKMKTRYDIARGKK